LSSSKQKYQGAIFFEEILIFRLKESDKVKINKILKKNQDVYENMSHYIRCCIIQDLRNFDKNGKRLGK
jgi:hypothetical protein